MMRIRKKKKKREDEDRIKYSRFQLPAPEGFASPFHLYETSMTAKLVRKAMLQDFGQNAYKRQGLQLPSTHTADIALPMTF